MALNLKTTRLTPAQLAKKEKERKLLEQAAQKTAERRTAIKTGDDIALENVKPVGKNLFLHNVVPITADDNIAEKAVKGLVNATISTVDAPFELARKVAIGSGNVLFDKKFSDVPKETSYMKDIVLPALPQKSEEKFDAFTQKHPLLGGAAQAAIDATDPAMWVGAGGLGKATKVGKTGLIQGLPPKQLGRLAKAEPKAAEVGVSKGQINPDVESNIMDNLKNTKIIDDAGKPLNVYHGTMETFDEFSPEMLGKNTGATSAKEGFFFTDNPKLADFYAQSREPDIKAFSDRVSKLSDQETKQLLFKNDDLEEEFFSNSMKDYGWNLDNVPGEDIRQWLSQKHIDTEGNTFGGAAGEGNFYDGIVEMQKKFKRAGLSDEGIHYTKGTVKDAHLNIENPYIHDYKGSFDDVGYTDVIKKAKELGHDGVIIKNTSDPLKTNLFIPFSEKQIVNKGRTLAAGIEDVKPKAITMELPTGAREANAAKPLPDGEAERGFSRNTRTDMNNPDNLRDSFANNPLSYEQLANKETLSRAQAVFDQGYEPARTELNNLLSEMKPEAIPLAKLLSRQAGEAGNMAAAREIIAVTADRLTQAGQFGQAARILREADPETFMLTMEKQLKNLNKEGAQVYGKKWKDVDLTPDELDLIGKIKRGDQQSYEDVFEQIHQRIANDLPASVMEKLNAWRHIAMLLNPKTQIRNVLGNTIMMGMRRSSKQVSAALQNVLLPAGQRTQVFKIKPEYQDAAAAYFEANKKDLLAGGNKYNEEVKLGMADKRVFQNNKLEATRKGTYKLLEMGDTPFYKNAYINRLASYAQAKGIKDFSELPQEAFDTAKREAEQATYKDASRLASYLNGVKHPGTNAGLGEKTMGVIAEAALPFTKTPINIIKRGIQYSPAGIINGISKWGKESAAAGIDEMAKGLTGSAILGLGYLLAGGGILTGKAADDADLKNYNANAGESPFSIMGKYTYDWAMPFAIPLAIGVELYNAVKGTEDEAKLTHVVATNKMDKLAEIAQLSSDIIYNSLAAAGDTTFNMSVMKSIKTLLANPKGFTAGLAQLPQNYASQYIPTVFGQVAGAIDPTVRKSYVSGNVPQSIAAGVESKTPFLSKLAEPKQTPFGEDTKRIENPLGRLAAQLFSPGNISVDQNIDPKIDKEIKRLGSLGLTEQIPTVVPNYVEKTQKHPKINLSPSETTEYQKRTGKLTLAAFKEVINSDEYKYATDDTEKNKTADEVKAELLAKAVKAAKAQAKAELLSKKGYKDTTSAGAYQPW